MKPTALNHKGKANQHRMTALLDVASRHGVRPELGSLSPAKILVPVDFTAAALWSIRCAGDIAAHHGSSICLLHVLEWGAFPDDLRNLILTKPDARLFQDTKAQLNRLARRELAFVSQVKVLVHSGKVAATIVSTARQEGSELIILTVDRCTWTERLRHPFFGSVATWVERHAPCLVLVLSIRKDVPLPVPPASNLRHTKSLGRNLAQAA